MQLTKTDNEIQLDNWMKSLSLACSGPWFQCFEMQGLKIERFMASGLSTQDPPEVVRILTKGKSKRLHQGYLSKSLINAHIPVPSTSVTKALTLYEIREEHHFVQIEWLPRTAVMQSCGGAACQDICYYNILYYKYCNML